MGIFFGWAGWIVILRLGLRELNFLEFGYIISLFYMLRLEYSMLLKFNIFGELEVQFFVGGC